MKRELKEGDVLYLGLIKLELFELDIIQADFNGVDSGSFETGYGFIHYPTVDGESVWIPKSSEQLLSYTPYTISKDGKLDGFSYEKPWQPKQNEVVWVRDYDTDSWGLGVFREMTANNQYRTDTHMKNNGMVTRTNSWKYCKPFNPSEIVTEQETETPTPSSTPQKR